MGTAAPAPLMIRATIRSNRSFFILPPFLGADFLASAIVFISNSARSKASLLVWRSRPGPSDGVFTGCEGRVSGIPCLARRVKAHLPAPSPLSCFASPVGAGPGCAEGGQGGVFAEGGQAEVFALPCCPACVPAAPCPGGGTGGGPPGPCGPGRGGGGKPLTNTSAASLATKR